MMRYDGTRGLAQKITPDRAGEHVTLPKHATSALSGAWCPGSRPKRRGGALRREPGA